MTDHLKSELKKLAQESQLYPQEMMVKVRDDGESLSIGLPVETTQGENRIALRPESVSVLAANGHQVAIQAGAGLASSYPDREYSEAGAKIVYSAEEVYQCDIILKINPPTPEEVELMKHRATLISALQFAKVDPEYFHSLNRKRITAVAYEMLEDEIGGLPLVRAMSEIAGSTAVLIAAEYLSNANGGKGIIMGGITGVPPTKVLILGAGTVAEYAARAAIGLGASVKVFDDNLYKLRRLKHALGDPQLYTSTIDATTLARALRTTNVAIGALRHADGRSICVVTEEMVQEMRPGSVIIDVSIDNGGCFETSEITTYDRPIFTKHGVIHYCVPNIASRVARTATKAISNIFTPILLHMADLGGVDDMIFAAPGFAKGVYCFHGEVTNEHVGRRYGLRCKELQLIIAASKQR
jgi:alanine dehydrogenase